MLKYKIKIFFFLIKIKDDFCIDYEIIFFVILKRMIKCYMFDYFVVDILFIFYLGDFIFLLDFLLWIVELCC